jgi:hypothetical protein
VEAGLPNFWEQDFASGSPAAHLPSQKSLAAGPQGRLHQRGGLYGWPIWLSTPENDKTDKKRAVAFVTEKPQPFRAFAPARPIAQCGKRGKTLQGRCRFFADACPETCRNWV